jgi:hypothetical protein
MKDLKIERNTQTGGICAYFKYNHNFYWADLSYIEFEGFSECMIFQADKNGDILSWLELYIKRDIPITDEALIECIEEFCKGEEKEQEYDTK